MKTWWFLITALFLTCFNPFAPSKGVPTGDFGVSPNDSPKNLLKNLEIAYERQSLTLFMSLLAEDFKFVVDQNFIAQNPSTSIRLKTEDIDGDSLPEVYWDRDWEEENHRRIFEKAKSIRLIIPCPDCEDTLAWKVWNDPVSDDTLGIYVTADSPFLELENQRGKKWTLLSSDQKFALKKNPVDTTLWIIGEWHDQY